MFTKHRNIMIILAVATLLRFWGIAAQGVHHDAALNSMRALGW